MICPKCGYDNDEFERVCASCSYDLSPVPPMPEDDGKNAEIDWPDEGPDGDSGEVDDNDRGGVEYDDDDDEDEGGVEYDEDEDNGGGVEYEDDEDDEGGVEHDDDEDDEGGVEYDEDEDDEGGVEYDEDDDEDSDDMSEGEEEELPPPPDDMGDGAAEDNNEDEVENPFDFGESDDEDEGEDEVEDEDEDEVDGIDYAKDDEEEGDGIEYDEDDDEEEEGDEILGDEGVDYEDEDEDAEDSDTDGADVELLDDHLFLGATATESIQLPVSTLKRHFVALGASGSGKTVFGKCVLEEATRNGIPSIIMDPQGDLASLILISSEEECEKHDVPLEILDEFREKAEVRIFTPASSKSIPLCINPLKTFPPDFSPEDAIRAFDTVSNSIASLLGYKSDSDAGKAASSFMYHILEMAWTNGSEIGDFKSLAKIVEHPDTLDIDDSSAIIKKKEREKLARKLRYLTMGLEKLLFSFGFPLDIDELFTPVEEGKVPVNVIYLNTLSSEAHKQFFIAVMGNELYNWMLTHPSKDVQALFYIDEVAPYIPPHPFNPPAKSILKLLFKQARKYGVSCMMCTQNPADVDYKALAQANTWALGRMMTPQDLKKVAGMLKAISSAEAEGILERLPVLKAGEFILLCPDVYDKAQQMKVRWLVTQHETMEAEALKDELTEEMLSYFKKRSKTIAALKKKEKEVVKEEEVPVEEPEGEVEDEDEEEEGFEEEGEAPEEPVEEETAMEETASEGPAEEPNPCAKCGKPLKAGATFCTKCGTPVKKAKKQRRPEKTEKCPKCGRKLRPTAKFCTGCGSKFVKVKSPRGSKISADGGKKKRFCTGCGNTLKPDATFCTKCGKKLGKK